MEYELSGEHHARRGLTRARTVYTPSLSIRVVIPSKRDITVGSNNQIYSKLLQSTVVKDIVDTIYVVKDIDFSENRRDWTK